jgi:hypothetical protein
MAKKAAKRRAIAPVAEARGFVDEAQSRWNRA